MHMGLGMKHTLGVSPALVSQDIFCCCLYTITHWGKKIPHLFTISETLTEQATEFYEPEKW